MLKASEEKSLKNLEQNWYNLPNIVILQTIRQGNSIAFNIHFPSRYQYILLSSTLVIIIFYYIECSSENIRLVKIGITGLSDDLTHDKVIASGPEFKMCYVIPIGLILMAALLNIKADHRLSQI